VLNGTQAISIVIDSVAVASLSAPKNTHLKCAAKADEKVGKS
jgi:hypothetical protein